MINLLFLTLIALMVITYKVFENDVLSPAFLFTASFLMSTFWAVLYQKKWELGLHSNTFMVLLGGVMLFAFVCYLTHEVYRAMHPYRGVHQNAYFAEKEISKPMLFLFFLLVLATMLISIRELTSWAGVPISQFISAGRKYDNLKFSSENSYSLPSWLSLARLMVYSGGYFVAYSFGNELAYRKRIPVRKALILILCMLNDMLLGGRSGAISLLLGYIFLVLFAIQKKRESNKLISFKSILAIGLLGFLVLATFREVGIRMQRSISSSTFDYLAMYLGADIKNLDIFLQQQHDPGPIWGSQTFVYLIRSFGGRLGLENAYYALDLPYHSINGLNLGNVYTTFYAYIYDFGYPGMVVLTSLFAMIVQLNYEIAKNSVSRNRSLLFTLIYSANFSSLLFSFFSDKFYEDNFTVAFLKMIILWGIYGFVCYYLFRGPLKSEDKRKYIDYSEVEL